MNPASRVNIMGMADTRVEGTAFAIKFVMTSATVFLNSVAWWEGEGGRCCASDIYALTCGFVLCLCFCAPLLV